MTMSHLIISDRKVKESLCQNVVIEIERLLMKDCVKCKMTMIHFTISHYKKGQRTQQTKCSNRNRIDKKILNNTEYNDNNASHNFPV